MNVNNNTLTVQHLKLYLRLKQQECIIGKSLEAFLVNLKIDPELWHTIKYDIDKTEVTRQELESSLKETVSNLYEELKSAKAMINREKIKTIDLEAFKDKLQSLWKKIQEFQSTLNSNTESFASGQSSLDAELGVLTRQIRKHKSYSSADSGLCKSVNSKAQSQKEECDYEEVEDFCTLLAKTGHTGSWGEEDHLLFVKLRKRHRNSTAALVAAVRAKCPDLSEEAVLRHDAWYRTYLELREKQRLAVQEWRARKERDRLARLSAERKDERVGSSAADEHLLQVAEHRRAEVERKKEQVRQWKEQRERQRLAEEERLRDQLRTRRELRESKRQARASRLRKLVAEHRRRSPPLQDQRDSSRVSSNMSAFFLQLYRARDQEFLEKRRNSLLSKGKSEPTSQPAIACNLLKTGESTLLKETRAWKEKSKATEHKPIQTLSYIKDLPKRALVGWRSYELPGPIL